MRDGAWPFLVAIDGCGGAGKSSLAAIMTRGLSRASVIHTDDFAFGWEFGWDWARFREQVLGAVLALRPARYQRFDWSTCRLAEWHEARSDVHVLILEGVQATTREPGNPWHATVWVEAPRDIRLQRGLSRDGEPARPLWEEWMAAEDSWVASEQPSTQCDFIVDGTRALAGDRLVEG